MNEANTSLGSLEDLEEELASTKRLLECPSQAQGNHYGPSADEPFRG